MHRAPPTPPSNNCAETNYDCESHATDSVYVESRGVAYSIVLELTFPVILLPPLLIDDLAEF